MRWRIELLFAIVLFVSSCKSDKEPDPIVISESHIVEPAELTDSILYNTRVIDFRRESDYHLGHLPNAQSIWRADMEDQSYPYGGMMASRDAVYSKLLKLCITSKDNVIVYDDRGGCDAARFWWILKNYGFDNVKVLNGGLEAWKNNGGAIEITPTLITCPLPEEVAWNPATMIYYISKDELSELPLDKALILDTRSWDEYTGKRQKKGAFKGGRIPGSIWIDWEEAVDFDNHGRLKPTEELKKVYGTLNVPKDHLIIPYCHSGVRSAHTTFVLTQILGYTNVRNYDGSWTEWSYFDLPIEKDSLTTILE